jgi:TPP-dependent trihydroxycyclohexane-1,2-dione (THcHDO) dehydratase
MQRSEFVKERSRNRIIIYARSIGGGGANVVKRAVMSSERWHVLRARGGPYAYRTGD